MTEKPWHEERWTEQELADIGMLDCTEDLAAGTLTFRFTNRVEVWTKAPPGYPTDGSMEVMRFDDRYYIPPGRES